VTQETQPADDVLRVAEFTRTPGARYRADGPYSGEEFRDTILFPRFEAARNAERRLVVDLDGVAGYATSFLEEAFGGLVRTYNLSPRQVLDTLTFVCLDEPELLEEVESYIREAG
jgi:hypothetical protein